MSPVRPQDLVIDDEPQIHRFLSPARFAGRLAAIYAVTEGRARGRIADVRADVIAEVLDPGFYLTRYKDIVAAGIANKCEIQVAYAIGIAKPLSINVSFFGSGIREEADIQKLLEHGDIFDFRPARIEAGLTLLDSRGVKVHGVSYTRGQAAQPGRTIAF